MFLFARSRLLLTRDTLCTGFWTQNNPPLITKNNILIVNTFFQSFMLKVMNVYSILITDKQETTYFSVSVVFAYLQDTLCFPKSMSSGFLNVIQDIRF